MINDQNYKAADREISLLSLNFKEGEKIKDESIVEILAQSRKIINKLLIIGLDFIKKKIL